MKIIKLSRKKIISLGIILCIGMFSKYSLANDGYCNAARIKWMSVNSEKYDNAIRLQTVDLEPTNGEYREKAVLISQNEKWLLNSLQNVFFLNYVIRFYVEDLESCNHNYYADSIRIFYSLDEAK